MDKTKAATIIIVVIIITGGLIVAIRSGLFSGLFPDGDDNITLPAGTQLSKFSFPLYATDTRTATASMTVTGWFDGNADGKMQYTELRSFADSSGTYTAQKEYPIGDAFDIWIQAYGSGYQTSYTLVHMSGDRNSDGSAKTLDQDVFILTTDDSVTYDGLINNIAWDDASDYNATLKGYSGLAEVSVVLSAADKGISSRVWEAVNYKSIYSGLLDIEDYTEEFWLKWDQITGPTVESGLVQAPDFFGIYMTIQDKIELAPTTSDFELAGDDNTNWHGAIVVSDSWGDLIYNTGESSAPRPTVSFNVGTITASGTTIATYGVAIHTGLTYEQFTSFQWTASAAYYLGTPGNDWDWTWNA